MVIIYRWNLQGRKKILEGKNVTSVIEDEIQNLVDKLKEMRKGSKLGQEDAAVKSCSNFDEQASVLRRRLAKLGSMSEEKRMEKIREMAEQSLSMNANPRDDIDDDSSPNASSIRQDRKVKCTSSNQSVAKTYSDKIFRHCNYFSSNIIVVYC